MVPDAPKADIRLGRNDVHTGISMADKSVADGNTAKKSTVLIALRLETEFRELVRVARVLKAAGRYDPVFYLYTLPIALPEGVLRKVKAVCDAEGFPVIAGTVLTDVVPEEHTPAENTPPAPSRPGIRAALKRSLPHFLLFLLKLVRNLFNYTRWYLRERAVVKTVCPSILVIGEDGVGGNRVLIKRCNRSGIPALIVPYEFSTIQQPVNWVLSQHDYTKEFGVGNCINRVTAKMFPKWIYTYNGIRLFREPASTVIPDELFRIAPPHPWSVHGGRGDTILASSRHLMRQYQSEGIPEEKMVLTGSLADDDLSVVLQQKDALRADLCRTHNLTARGKLVVCSIPPDYTHVAETCAFASYEKLLDFWVASVSAHDSIQVIFQLHPSVQQRHRQYLESLGVTLSSQDITRLIPVCDLFITSVSSVIRLAIVCGIPVINYDVYRFNYRDYDAADGVFTIQDTDQFREMVDRLILDASFYEHARERQEACSGEWGLLDGKVKDRMIRVFDDVTDR